MRAIWIALDQLDEDNLRFEQIADGLESIDPVTRQVDAESRKSTPNGHRRSPLCCDNGL